MTTNDLAALRAAVLAAPDDPTPRLILADALDDSGDGPRAEWERHLATMTDGETALGHCWEHVRTWEQGAYRLDLWQIYRRTPSLARSGDRSRESLAYELWHEGAGPVFYGADFHTPGCVDSDEAVAALLSFLSLRPGDTDREYFDSYSPEQLEWAQEHGEELSAIAHDLERGNWHNPAVAALAHNHGVDDLPTFADGGYPLLYLTADNGELCPACANSSECRHATKDDPQWHIAAWYVHYEGPPAVCYHCGAEVTSAYGNPDNPEPEYGADAVILIRDPDAPGYLLTHRDGRNVLFQTDWDWPSLASSFGWSPAEAGATGCGCNATDGTVPCPECHTQPGAYISSAADWLDAHEGETIHDPGYFSED